MTFTNKQYDVLKKIAVLILPLAEFISALATIWGLPYGKEIVATLTALHAFLGACLNASSNRYYKEADGDAEREEP